METRSEGLSGPEWDNSPLVLPTPLQEALKGLSEVLHASVFNGSGFHIVLEQLWEAEEAATAALVEKEQ